MENIINLLLLDYKNCYAMQKGVRSSVFWSRSESVTVLFGRSRCKGTAPAPPSIKQTKLSMIFSSLVHTLIKFNLKNKYL